MTLVGYKGLPQGSVLSPLLYNIIGSCVDRFIPSGCGFLQYAFDLVVYMAHTLFNVARGLVQTACISLNVFFSSMGLRISASKSDATCFKYLGIFFDAGLRWSCHAKMPPKIKLVEIGGRCFLGSASILFDTAV
jgi:hypothetical protein